MNPTKTLSTLLVTLLALLNACQTPEEPTEAAPQCVAVPSVPAHPQAAVLQNALDQAIQAGIPGAVALVATPDGIWVGTAGVANLQHGTAVAPCHRARIASLTKNFTAVAVLRLVQQGLVDLDAPATRYLPSGHPAHGLANVGTATLRQLMNHTSGLYDYDTDTRYNLDALNQPGRVFTVHECLAYAKNKPATAAPGLEYRYCNTGYIVLGEVAAAVTGQSPEDAVRDLVFAPIGLQATAWLPVGALPNDVMRGYDNRFGNTRLTDVSHFRLGTGTDGGLVSNVFDLYRYQHALYAIAGLLDSTHRAAMLQNRVRIPNQGTAQERAQESGLGMFQWEFRGHRCWANIGGQYGYRAFMAYFPENNAQIIVLTNASLIANDDAFFSLLDHLAEGVWP